MCVFFFTLYFFVMGQASAAPAVAAVWQEQKAHQLCVGSYLGVGSCLWYTAFS